MGAAEIALKRAATALNALSVRRLLVLSPRGRDNLSDLDR
jgi:hypothetical protein